MKYYLFSERHETGHHFFCGDAWFGLPTDEVTIGRDTLTIATSLQLKMCLAFDSLEELEEYSANEVEAWDEATEYAERAMRCEEYYSEDY